MMETKLCTKCGYKKEFGVCGEFKGSDAKEMNNCAGKIINSVKVQLEYSALRKEKPEIDFLNID